MLARISSFGLCGLEAYPVAIETDISPGLPNITVVGLPDNAVKESRERIRAAIKNSGFEFPAQRITINLAPADTKKQGPCYDLAIALGVLAAQDLIPLKALSPYSFIGELWAYPARARCFIYCYGGRSKPMPGTYCTL